MPSAMDYSAYGTSDWQTASTTLLLTELAAVQCTHTDYLQPIPVKSNSTMVPHGTHGSKHTEGRKQ